MNRRKEMEHEIIPNVMWGFISLVFAGMIITFATWLLYCSFYIKDGDPNKFVSIILYTCSAITIIIGLWNLGIIIS